MPALTGFEKAAILSETIGSKKAALVFRHLSEDEINIIIFEIAKIAVITNESRQKVLSEVRASCDADLEDLLESQLKEIADLMRSWLSLGY